VNINSTVFVQKHAKEMGNVASSRRYQQSKFCLKSTIVTMLSHCRH